MKNFNKINSSDIKVGMKFSAPVFFEDGENMFLAEEKVVKPYHLFAISRWNISYFLTFGHIKTEDESSDVDELEEIEEVEAVEELEELEECEAV